MSEAHLVRAVNVIKHFGNNEVLKGVDLTVDKGEVVCLLGPSGSGKTTLLNCLSGLDDIDSGQVVVQGRDLFAMRDGERTEHRAHTMGFIFQAFNLIPVFTAAENVELPLLLVGVAPSIARARAVAMLDRVGLGHRVDHRPAEMSGGEQQRVTIARALVGQPAIVWADEPTGNLDSAMATEIMDLLCQLNERDGQTIVLVTHDPTSGARASRLIRMRDGRLVEDKVIGRAQHDVVGRAQHDVGGRAERDTQRRQEADAVLAR